MHTKIFTFSSAFFLLHFVRQTKGFFICPLTNDFLKTPLLGKLNFFFVLFFCFVLFVCLFGLQSGKVVDRYFA